MQKFSVLLYIAIALLGIGITYQMGATIYEERQLKNWPRTSGIITSSKVCSNSVQSFAYAYWPCIDYQYAINGRQYQSTSITLSGSQSVPKNKAQELVAEFRAGANVDVFYNPKDPSISFIKATDTPWYTYLFFVGGIFLFLCAIALWKINRNWEPDQ